jgi:DNA modification methylase
MKVFAPPAVEHLHRLHSYCARFPSEIAEAAIDQFTRPGDSVCDPFCGSGTTLVAGLVRRRLVVGADIDLLAGLLSTVKCSPLATEKYRTWRRRFAKRLEELFQEISDGWSPTLTPRPGDTFSIGSLKLKVPLFPQLNYWFPPQLIAFLTAIAHAAHSCQDDHYERVGLVSLSAAIIAKWPNTLSYAMDIDHTRPHREIQRFSRARVLEAYLKRLDRTTECLGALHQAYTDAGVVGNLPKLSRVVCPHDARNQIPEVSEGSQALVVTSPPYFNAVDYPRAHRLSVCWMNGHVPEDLSSRRDYVGLRHIRAFKASEWLQEHKDIQRLVPVALRATNHERRLAAFFADISNALRETWRALRPDGHALLVIADNCVGGHRIKASQALVHLAKSQGFVEVNQKPRRIASLRRRFPVGTFGFDGPMTHEHVVVLKKPKTRKGHRY